MNEPHKLDYERAKGRTGHSPYGIAFISIAISIILFALAVAILESLGINPMNSNGNLKEISIATTGAILGLLLAVRAFHDQSRKQILATVGLVLNTLAFLAAAVLLPKM